MSDDISHNLVGQTPDGSGKHILLEGTRLYLNPEADVADLFRSFNDKFFWNKLAFVEVRWSPRMTLCAGLCVYHRRPGYCSIRLSRPLLSLRGQLDLVETLLHEMIHAFLFVTENNKDRDGHGPEFLKHMVRINNEAGLNISVYHTFGDEVKHYQQHVWLCDGPCQQRHPYYGKVHRAVNREPGPNDLWWLDHQRDCGGSFTKISQPEGFQPSKKKTSLKKKDSTACKNKDIRSFFKVIHHSNKNILDNASCELEKSNQINKDEVMSNANVTQKGEIHVQNVSEGDSGGSSDESVLGIFGAIFSAPYRFLKRRSEDPDPSTIKVRKPDLGAQPKSKMGILKNLIKVPDQPTLDAFYKKKRSVVSGKAPPTLESTSNSSQSKKSTLKQPSVQSFFNNQ
ncbi:hypothetical protein ONE63_006128 [Megalurothrips usitatus]|uniref:SprT-like domain-containing protein n=1 Tax=Megalurothrips usitatus TaxID=439358 RepID=A0AAV7XTG2_9NEOP|nr:hypothetical protein ONE63_006128 [Megalurothrips usitatus]